MDRSNHEELDRNVVAQANFRLKFGVAVALTVVGIHTFGPYQSSISMALVLGMLCLYGIYAFGARYLATHPTSLTNWELVLITAVIDPLMLSMWLYFAGESSTLVVGFYLFTTMGFGFRVGALPMHICQLTSLAGFALVVMTSDFLPQHLLFVASHAILLIVVPLYAASLIKRIQTAKEVAEVESRAKSQLLAKVSHELRTPLTGIVADAQLLEVEAPNAATVSRARSIQNLAKTLDSEIKQLLDLSTAEDRTSAKREPPRSFSLAYTGTHVLKSMRSLVGGKAVMVELDFDESIKLPVMGYHQQLVAVLTNLAGNAVKFTDSGSVVLRMRLVQVENHAYRIWFAVEDTGIGIAPEHHDKIFQPFFQVEDGADRKYGGTGLGISIARELVQKMGGELKVQSALGLGSVFHFELLLPVDANEAEAEAGVRKHDVTMVTGKRVLVADDNATNLALMKEMLLKDGHQVTAVDKGHDAIVKLSANTYDMIFLDYNMGDVDGATVYQTYAYSRINLSPTFFITADTTAMTTKMLEDLGVTGVIYKPLTFEKLRAAFEQVFPGEGVAVKPEAPAARRSAVELSAVPVEFVDMAVIEGLREIKDTPEFLHKIISDAMSDLSELSDQMDVSIASRDLHQVHRQAHAMKGVSLNVGAVRLAALSDRLMTMSNDMLCADPPRWQSELANAVAQTCLALDGAKEAFLPQKVVNR
ncbi:ATP-binding protein [Luteimonas sp. RIT-PG2_3]